MIRYTLHFSGHVQGVGFRYTTRQIAQGHRVAGYVMNLPDRRVELVVEGEEPDIRAFVNEVKTTMSGHIRSTTEDRSPATGEFGQPAKGALTIRH
ncbi:MAG: acylphosphatase [Phycisphaera sp.]|nr:acylphosphatase [Phycisphaera sp.]